MKSNEDEDDEFHESLDRILSSSCSSTSASDDDAEPRRRRHGSSGGGGGLLLRGVSARLQSMYDVWSSPLTSVEERRRRLLKSLGLLDDPSISRRPPVDDEMIEIEPDRPVPAETAAPEEDRYCTIRNLDNGEEFVVKELTEDGMWEKLKEVGTGRQLTMEEFQVSVIGHSPIVQELMRRQTDEECGNGAHDKKDGIGGSERSKRRGSWFKNIRNIAGGGSKRCNERRSSDERDTSSEKGGRRSSSATDDGLDVHFGQGNERVRVRQCGKPWKELSGLYVNQEFQGHRGAVWIMRFSSDGRLLASAGEDCVIRVWQVVESKRRKDLFGEKGVEENGNCLMETVGAPMILERDNSEKRRKAKALNSRKSFSLEHVMLTDYVFGLSERPVCSFQGHQKDVLDLSWSRSEQLLSSSMDKTVRLWDMYGNSCLKVFSHSDYVTCIQFNPIDDNYFISGSLDSKVRLWSIKDRLVVDWVDLHEMITAVCYTPDGQGALVGSHKGTCYFYKLSGNRVQEKTEIDLQNKKKRSHLKKITGFQFIPGSISEVLITSADSRIRVVDNTDLIHKFKGFRNTSSQIAASLTSDGNHIICASEDSHVYIWRYDTDSRTGRSKGVVSVTQSYEHFPCRDVSVAAAWPGTNLHRMPRGNSKNWNEEDALSHPFLNSQADVAPRHLKSYLQASDCYGNSSNPQPDHISFAWSEDKPPLSPTSNKQSPQNSSELNIGEYQKRSAWGMVIVTAGRGGEIKVFQNFGYPIRV